MVLASSQYPCIFTRLLFSFCFRVNYLSCIGMVFALGCFFHFVSFFPSFPIAAIEWLAYR